MMKKPNNNNNNNTAGSMTETSPLLLMLHLPSANSTERPSLENLQREDFGGGEDEEEASSRSRDRLLLNGSTTGGEMKKSLSEIQLSALMNRVDSNITSSFFSSYNTMRSSTTANDNKKQRKAMLDFFVVLLGGIAVFAIIVMSLIIQGRGAGSGGAGGADEDVSVLPTDNNIMSHGVPLSFLDPVSDLGLANYSRPQASMPPKAILAATTRQGEEGGRKLKANTNTKTTSSAALPTNSWYQNMLLVGDNNNDIAEPANINRAYSIPYVVDAIGPIPGLRVHPNRVGATSDVVQVYVQENFGLTLGAAMDATSTTAPTTTTTHRYNVVKMTNLGLTLRWEYYPMVSSIVKGMPYATMIYDGDGESESGDSNALPTIASEIGLAQNPIIDGNRELPCDITENPFFVEREIKLLFGASDFTWLVFVSEPVMVQCVTNIGGDGMQIQVVERVGVNVDDPLIVRVALLKSCSSGHGSPVYCHQEKMHPTALLATLGQGEYATILRQSAHLYPGPNTSFNYRIVDYDDNGLAERNNNNKGKIQMIFDWDVQMFPQIQYKNGTKEEYATTDLITYALPHHADLLSDGITTFEDDQVYCTPSLVGPACLVEGSTWNLIDDVPDIRLQARRPPAPWSIPSLAKSLRNDLKFTLPDYYRRGAGDTYFSGKQLAKLGRIILIAQELVELCSTSASNVSVRPKRGTPMSEEATSSISYEQACKKARSALPSPKEISMAVENLQKSVEVWLNGKAETPFVYDSSWGGVVSCGCLFDGSKCSNQFPNCPSFSDPGLNFGNGFYNDMHFHYGYHIFAAAVVSHFDHDWGKSFFERVLLLIRNIANPSEDDTHFPTWRHKDWFNGHSWASGVARPPYTNGRNQESSSEAIAAYEAIGLYGKVMSEVWDSDKGKIGTRQQQKQNLQVANEVQAIGQVMAASELRSARKYWHVARTPDRTSIKIYPSNYGPNVIGILWQMMAQFQTYFGRAPYLMYGIQLLPITPISEQRDDVSWVKEMYAPLAESCEADEGCYHSGWGVLQAAMLATAGHQQGALEKVMNMPASNFDGPAGDGHSLSNTIWYIATRPTVDKPLSLEGAEDTTEEAAENNEADLTCHRPESCTDYVLDTIAGTYSCRQRIQWLMQRMGMSQEEACTQVAVTENPKQCGACNPSAPSTKKKTSKKEQGEGAVPSSSEELPQCPPCSPAECSSDLNRCPRYKRTYVCTEGPSEGGCSPVPWIRSAISSEDDEIMIEQQQCKSCCELTNCPMRSVVVPADQPSATKEGDVDDCPPCSKDVCHSRVNQCPVSGAAPFLCHDGPSTGGCSPRPWAVGAGNSQCHKCCNVLTGCSDGGVKL